MSNLVTEIIDTFFNGRPAPEGRGREQSVSVTIRELVRRGISVVRVEGKLYRVTAEEIDPRSLKTKAK
jgi:hypothetical protein